MTHTIIYLLFVGIKKRDPFCEPIISADAWQLDDLMRSAEYFNPWKKSSSNYTLTSATAEANTQTLKAIECGVRCLITEKRLSKILVGKFSSDPLEQRFGWLRQLSGANFYIGCKQLLEAEKRIRALSLIKSGQSLSFESDMIFGNPIAEHVQQVGIEIKNSF